MFSRQFSTKANAVAVFANSIWSALLSFAFVRFYLDFLGVESYGLIGVFATVQAFIVLLDFGLSPTINRELARLSAHDGNEQEMLDIKRTLEVPNWITAVLIGGLLMGLSPIIASFWVIPKDLSTTAVMQAFLIMSVTVALQYSLGFYMGALIGLRKQVVLSSINILCGTLRSVGALVVVAFVSPTIQAFLLWQGSVVVLQTCLMIFTLYRSLPDGRGQFQKELFRNIWKFASGMTGITVVSLVLTQTDKVVLSRMLTLENFGYYSLAALISTTAIGMFVSAIANAIFPELSRLVARGDEQELREFYHQSCQTVSVFVFPVTIMLALFSYEAIIIWIGKEEIASNTYSLLTLIAIGTGLNALMWPPHYLQMAYAWTGLLIKVGIGMIILLTPLIIAGVYNYGAIGGAAGWAILTAIFLPLVAHLMHRKILQGEEKRWYLEDLLRPFAASLAVALLGRIFVKHNAGRIELAIELFVISSLTLFAAALSSAAARKHLTVYKNRVLGMVAGLR